MASAFLDFEESHLIVYVLELYSLMKTYRARFQIFSVLKISAQKLIAKTISKRRKFQGLIVEFD